MNTKEFAAKRAQAYRLLADAGFDNPEKLLAPLPKPERIAVYDKGNPDRLLGYITGSLPSTPGRYIEFACSRPVSLVHDEMTVSICRVSFEVSFRCPNWRIREAVLVTSETLENLLTCDRFLLPGETEGEREDRLMSSRFRSWR